MSSSANGGVLSRGALTMMSAAAGITVANVYLCQPLLEAIARDFQLSASAAGWVASAAQVGYALGILLIVPIADRADPRKLIRRLLACTCAALLCAAASPNIYFLVLAALAVSVSTVLPQVLVPLAVAASEPSRAGRVVGSMQSGIILGILLSRTLSGAVGQYSGSWRTAYLLAAVLCGALFFILPRCLPARDKVVAASSYLSLLASLPRLLIQWPGLRLSAALGATVFGAFSAFWATLAFHLAQPPFNFGPAQAGLFGLWGLLGALLAPYGGRLADRYGASVVNAIGVAAAAVAFALFILGGGTSVLALVIGVNFLDFGNQAGQIANQARIFKLDPAARARLNTVYMVLTFAGGASGSLLAVWAWGHGGWHGVGTVGAVLLAIAAGLLLLDWFVSTKARRVTT
jgi:predicted MFS family arabinose efflux permease